MSQGVSDHEPTRGDRKPGGPTCAQVHPLLDNVRCQRLQRHPGKHGAYVNELSVEATVEWDQEGERAG